MSCRSARRVRLALGDREELHGLSGGSTGEFAVGFQVRSFLCCSRAFSFESRSDSSSENIPGINFILSLSVCFSQSAEICKGSRKINRLLVTGLIYSWNFVWNSARAHLLVIKAAEEKAAPRSINKLWLASRAGTASSGLRVCRFPFWSGPSKVYLHWWGFPKLSQMGSKFRRINSITLLLFLQEIVSKTSLSHLSVSVPPFSNLQRTRKLKSHFVTEIFRSAQGNMQNKPNLLVSIKLRFALRTGDVKQTHLLPLIKHRPVRFLKMIPHAGLQNVFSLPLGRWRPFVCEANEQKKGL